MKSEHSHIKKVRFYLSCAVLYVCTICFGWYIWQSVQLPSTTAHAAPVIQKPYIPAPTKPKIVVISGRPIRIIIPDSQIDRVVDPGYYNSIDGSWTLSETHAQFAMISTLANNVSGETFIYGHGTWAVFESLGDVTPKPGAIALVYTDNGHIFQYSFENRRDLTPDDTSVLNYSGPPILVIQTCSGSFSQWRSMFQFGFDKVLQ